MGSLYLTTIERGPPCPRHPPLSTACTRSNVSWRWVIPIFVYQCEHCGLRFEKLWRTQAAASGQEEMECQSCGESAGKQVTAANHTFAHTPTGPVPQNTGVHSIDYSYDRVIGRDAAEKWAAIEARNDEKRRVLRHSPEATKADLGRTLDGGYEVMDSQVRDQGARARALNELAHKRLQKSPKNQDAPTRGPATASPRLAD